MSVQGQSLLTPEEYLKLERTGEVHSQFYRGRIYAVPGVSYRHVIINQLRDRPCTVSTNDLRLHVGGLYTYPDVVVICGEPKFIDGRKGTLVSLSPWRRLSLGRSG